MQWPKDKRNEFYAEVLKKRGAAALDALRTGINREWSIRQLQPSLL